MSLGSLFTYCPTCDAPFANDHTMRLHHYRAHGESVAWTQSECEVCGEEYEHLHIDEDRRFCSNKCNYRNRRQEAERRAREEAEPAREQVTLR